MRGQVGVPAFGTCVQCTTKTSRPQGSPSSASPAWTGGSAASSPPPTSSAQGASPRSLAKRLLSPPRTGCSDEASADEDSPARSPAAALSRTCLRADVRFRLRSHRTRGTGCVLALTKKRSRTETSTPSETPREAREEEKRTLESATKQYPTTRLENRTHQHTTKSSETKPDLETAQTSFGGKTRVGRCVSCSGEDPMRVVMARTAATTSKTVAAGNPPRFALRGLAALAGAASRVRSMTKSNFEIGGSIRTLLLEI